jgi:signal transduction histidine kinase
VIQAMDEVPTIELTNGLASVSGRHAAAQLLATRLGAETLILFVRDADLGAFLPAPGMQQTLPGGPGWADLLRRCAEPGEHAGTVAFPDRTSTRSALALSTADGLALVLIGGEAHFGERNLLCLPLLAAALRAELAAEAAHGKERAAREAARHASNLTAVLDATRSELERALGEARRLNADLKRADEAKDQFLAMLAHELRNPLAPIVSALSILRRDSRDGPASQRLLEVMHRQTGHLTRLVDDLLDVSRISHGRIELRLEPVTMRSALQQALESVRPLIERERHALSVSLPEPPLWVAADPVRLTQIFTNLLTNAAKYTAPGGRIEVEVKRAGTSAEVRLRDTGIGIEKELLPRVFELFMQAPRALDRSKGGLGIGLTLVYRLVALHGGTVEARSEGAGRGSEFIVRLPTCEPPREAEAPASRPPEKEGLPPPRQGRRVLVVDDNRDSVETLAEILRLDGFVVRVEGDGEAAVAAAREFAPEVVLLDIGLPKMDGYEVARELRKSLPSSFLVALSGYGGKEYRDRSAEAGFDSYLVKPVEIADLLAVIGNATSRG